MAVELIEEQTLRSKILELVREYDETGCACWIFQSQDRQQYDIHLEVKQRSVEVAIFSLGVDGYDMTAPLWTMDMHLDNEQHWRSLHGAVHHIQMCATCGMHRGPLTSCCRRAEALSEQNRKLMLQKKAAEVNLAMILLLLCRR